MAENPHELQPLAAGQGAGQVDHHGGRTATVITIPFCPASTEVHRAHSTTPTSSDLQHGKEKELQDDGPSHIHSLSSKRWGLEMGLENLSEIVASCGHHGYGYDKIVIPIVHKARLAALERSWRLKMLLSLVGTTSRSKEAEGRKLFTMKSQWHCYLELDNPACPIIASNLFDQAFCVL
ncbi:unnamed protein product [Calypogeia fissa]